MTGFGKLIRPPESLTFDRQMHEPDTLKADASTQYPKIENYGIT